MKRLLVLSLFSFCFTVFLVAQDVITLRSGEEIKGKVFEIQDNVIKYKKADNLDGPVYSLPKSDVFMIHYQNGTKEVITPANQVPSIQPKPKVEATPKQKAEPNPLADEYRHRGKTKIIAGAVVTGVGGAILITGMATALAGATTYANAPAYGSPGYSPYQDDGTGTMIAGYCLLGVGAVMTIAGPIVLSKGIKLRKQAKQVAYLNFGSGENINYDRYLHVVNNQRIANVTLTF